MGLYMCLNRSYANSCNLEGCGVVYLPAMKAFELFYIPCDNIMYYAT